MRVLFAPHHFGTLLTPDLAARALAAGWQEAKPDDEVVIHPHSDGSIGFLTVVPGIQEIVTIATSEGEYPVSLVRKPQGDNPWHTVYCQTDTFGPTHGLTQEELLAGSSAFVGRMLAHILDAGARRIVIGTGFAPWHDGGAGLLVELARSRGLSVPQTSLKAGEDIDVSLSRLVEELRPTLRSVEIIVAATREVPLRGLHGAGNELSQGNDITPTQAQAIEGRTSAFVNAVDNIVKEHGVTSLLAVDEVLASRRPYSGSGGGVAFILLALGGKLFPGAWVTGEETGLSLATTDVDLVVTGSDVIAGGELGDGVVADVATRAGVVAIPVIAVAKRLDASRGQLQKAGVTGAYQVVDTPSDRPQLLAPDVTEEALVERGRRLAKTWSR